MPGQDMLRFLGSLRYFNKNAGRVNSSYFSIALLFTIVFLSIVNRSSQVLEFLEEPSLYYYTRPGFATVIPCKVVDVDSANGSQTPITAVFFINGTPVLDQQDLPPDHVFWVDGQVVLGVLVLNTLREFSGWTYSCQVERGGQVLMSLNSTLYVGDGRPLAPVEDPCYMTDAGLTSLTLMWGYAPVPLDASLLGYNITYWSLDDQSVHESLETNSNDTTITLSSLSPGMSYMVVVQGFNSLGAGIPSVPVKVTVMVGSLPPSPTGVMATIESVNQSIIAVEVKWKEVVLDLDDSTPLLDYLIYYKESEAILIKTVNVSTTSAIVELRSDNISSEFVMGVATRNLAGQSDITFSNLIHILIGSEPSPHSISMVLIGSIIGAIAVLVIASILVFIVIICFRHCTRNIYHVNPTGTINKSPEKSRKKSMDIQNDLFDKDDVIQMSDRNHSNHNNVHVTVEVQEEKLNDTVRVKRPSLDYIRNNPSSLSIYESRTL